MDEKQGVTIARITIKKIVAGSVECDVELFGKQSVPYALEAGDHVDVNVPGDVAATVIGFV
jgi:hypothetical protein